MVMIDRHRWTLPDWEYARGQGPVVMMALGCGHAIPPSLEGWLALSTRDRLGYEQSHLTELLGAASNRLLVHRSRFTGDLSRPCYDCLYPVEKQGLSARIWKSGLPENLVAEMMAYHRDFYQKLEQEFRQIHNGMGDLVVVNIQYPMGLCEGVSSAEDETPYDLQVQLPSLDVARKYGPTGPLSWMAVLKRELSGVSPRLRIQIVYRDSGSWFGEWLATAFPKTAWLVILECRNRLLAGPGQTPDFLLLDDLISRIKRWVEHFSSCNASKSVKRS